MRTNKSWRKAAIGTGAVVGIAGAALMMVPTASRSSAAIPVIDLQNIEQAYQTVLNTLQQIGIMNEQSQKMDTAMQSLPESVQKETLDKLQKQQQPFLSGDFGLPKGISNQIELKSKSMQAIWDQRIGNVDDIVNGRISWDKIALQEIERQQALEEEFRLAAAVANQSQENSKNTAETVSTALDASNNAEGNKEVAQAQNVLAAAQIYATQEQTRVLAHLSNALAVSQAAENLARVKQRRIEDASRENAAKQMETITNR